MKCSSAEELAVLRWAAGQAKRVAGAKRVLLFGSRARGDADDRSDFDIALEATHPERISELRALYEESPLTLLAFDVVNLSEVSEVFRKRILAEAKDITAI